MAGAVGFSGIINKIKEYLEADKKLYPELRDADTALKLLDNEDSAFYKILYDLCTIDSDRDALDLLCSLTGAINYIAYQEEVACSGGKKYEDVFSKEEDILKNAKETIWGDKLDSFIKDRYDSLRNMTLRLKNCPSIPQRIFPLVTYLPKTGCVGLLELGCSRGDLGIAAMNVEKLLRVLPQQEGAHGRYVFRKPSGDQTEPGEQTDSYKEFRAEEGQYPERHWRDTLRRSRSIDKYFGVDLLAPEQTEINWMLALWGLKDPRRKTLDQFYLDFPYEENASFKRVTADACRPEKYMSEALDFFEDVDNLVIFTSYMVYQISTVEGRFALVDAVRKIRKAFLDRYPDKKFLWFNQGNSVKHMFNLDDKFNFEDLWFSELSFEDERLKGRDIAKLQDDCNSNWRGARVLFLYGGPGREHEISHMSANTLIDTLDSSGFSVEALEIPPEFDIGQGNDPKTYDADKEDYRNKVQTILKECKGYDIVLPYLHGKFGEDGELQKILEKLHIPYAGCDSISSRLAMEKELSRRVWNCEIPSFEFLTSERQKNRLTPYDWDQRLRKNRTFRQERMKIHYVKDTNNLNEGHWEIVDDDYVKYKKASDFEYKKAKVDDIDLSRMLWETLRHWEYKVIIYEAIDYKAINETFNADSDGFLYHKGSESNDTLMERYDELKKWLDETAPKDKELWVECYHTPPFNIPKGVVFKKDETEEEIKKKITGEPEEKITGEPKKKGFDSIPFIIKPVLEGSSIAVEVFDGKPETPEEKTRDQKTDYIVQKILEYLSDHPVYDSILVEEKIMGSDATVTVIGEGEDARALPPIKIIPQTPNGDYDYEAKYFREDTTYGFHLYPPEWIETMKNIAVKAYRMLGCRDFARVDIMTAHRNSTECGFSTNADRIFYVLEINTTPGATSHSLTPKAAKEAGFTLPQFWDMLMEIAFTRIENDQAALPNNDKAALTNYGRHEIPRQDCTNDLT